MLLEIRGLTKRFGDKTALRNVNLALDHGETVALTGPNGAGKTTLLRIVALLTRPTEGKVLFEGARCDGDENHKRYLRRQMAIVFQRPVLLDMTVAENISVALRVRGVKEREIQDRVDEVTSQLSLSEFRARDARTLSGGEAQRVAMARALVCRPKLLLLDEPTSSADPRNALMIERAVREANSRMGTAILVATHSPYQAKRLADHAAFLLEGEIIERGRTSEILTSPSDRRTAAYVSGVTP